MKKFIISGIVSLAAASALMGAGSQGDIVFVIDESGSMQPYIDTVKANVDSFVQQLADNGVDYQLGLVGFGWNDNPNPHVVTQLTADKDVFVVGLNTLVAYGGYEPGFDAVTLGLSGAMEPAPFRAEAGTCVIMITDEDADPEDPIAHEAAKTTALAALDDKSAIYYGVIDTSNPYYAPTSTADYGMDGGSLAAVTGGMVWDIRDFGDEETGKAIMAEVMERCISEAIQPEVDFDVHPQSCPNPINVKSGGLTPMAILGSDSLNVNDIDPDTLKVNGFPIAKYAYEDVAGPYDGEQSEEASKYECWEFVATEEVPEYLGDGHMDLTFKIKTKDLELEKGEQYLEVTGAKYDGTPINGKDVVWVK